MDIPYFHSVQLRIPTQRVSSHCTVLADEVKGSSIQLDSPVDDNLSSLTKHLCKTIVSMPTRPTQMKSQHTPIHEFHRPDGVIRISSVGEFGMSDVLPRGEYPVHLFGGGRRGNVEEPSGYVDIVDS